MIWGAAILPLVIETKELVAEGILVKQRHRRPSNREVERGKFSGCAEVSFSCLLLPALTRLCADPEVQSGIDLGISEIVDGSSGILW